MSRGRTVAVAVAGTASDGPALGWALARATVGQEVVLAHAAGSLPVQMSYADRHHARRERRAVAQQVIEQHLADARRQAPGQPVRGIVRLCDQDALLPVLAEDAGLLVPSSPGWVRRPPTRPASPVLAVVPPAAADSPVLRLATAYAGRGEPGVRTVEPGEVTEAGLLQLAGESSLVLLPIPGRDAGGPSWATILALLAASPRPVALVGSPTSGTTDR